MGIPIIGSVVGLVEKAVDRLIPDKGKAAAMKHEIAMTLVTSDLAQMEINKEEASHKSIFVAGWRPAVGWICAFALFYNYIATPMLGAWASIYHPAAIIPQLDITELMTLLFGMLGMGTLRSYDKQNGVSTNFIKGDK